MKLIKTQCKNCQRVPLVTSSHHKPRALRVNNCKCCSMHNNASFIITIHTRICVDECVYLLCCDCVYRQQLHIQYDCAASPGAALPLVCAQLMQNPRSIKINRIRSPAKTLLISQRIIHAFWLNFHIQPGASPCSRHVDCVSPLIFTCILSADSDRALVVVQYCYCCALSCLLLLLFLLMYLCFFFVFVLLIKFNLTRFIYIRRFCGVGVDVVC